MHLSVIIPSYNGEDEVGKTLEAVNGYLSKQPYDWEILVSVDGSKDKTAKVVEGLKPQMPKLKLLDEEINHGKGWAVRRGMLEAQGDYRIFMDDDNSTTIDQIENFWPHIKNGYDVVIGSIEVSGAKINEHAQWYRRWLGHLSKYVIRIVAGLWDIKDSQRGFKLFSAKAAKDIFSRAKIDRFGFDIEVLALAKKLGYKIKELPVIWNNPSGSSVKLKSYVAVFVELLKIRWWLWSGHYK